MPLPKDVQEQIDKGFADITRGLDEKLKGLTAPDGRQRPDLRVADPTALMKFSGVYRYARKFGGPERIGNGGAHRSIAEKVAAGDEAGRALGERMINWMRAFAVRDLNGMMQYAAKSGERALDSNNLAEGGALVPVEFAQDVIELLGQMTPLATTEFLRVIPMTTERMVVPRVTVRPIATYGTQGSPTTATGIGTQPSFGEVELVAREAVLLVPVDEKWLADISIDGITYLTELFAEVLAELRNQKLILGTGTSEPEGVLNNTSINQGAVGSTPTYAGASDKALAKYVVGCYHHVKPRYRRNFLWLTSTAGMAKLVGLQDDVGRFLLQQLTDEPFARLLGKPIFETEAISDTQEDGTHTVLLGGNFKYYVFGDRQQMEARTDNGGGYFAARQVAIRVTERYDGKVGQPVAFVRSLQFPNT
ncbi:MAG TPA: phage major capsid protein [Gaiellaceae bacterium]|nr:phage major capsid protein [Gaiellaceae bacterium]